MLETIFYGVFSMENIIHKRLIESVDVMNKLEEHLGGRIAAAADMIVDCYKAGGGLLLFGNGGSAADAQHIAGEMVGRFLKERRPLKAQALSTDTSVLTCVANDYAYEEVFSRAIIANGCAGDVAVGLTTSGNSANVIAALEKAKEIGMKTIAFTGEGGGKCAEVADVLLDVPSKHTPYVQQGHMTVYHIICELVENAIAAEEDN